MLQKITAHNKRIDGFEVRHRFERLGTRYMKLNARRIEAQGGTQMILLSMEDVTRENRCELLYSWIMNFSFTPQTSMRSPCANRVGPAIGLPLIPGVSSPEPR